MADTPTQTTSQPQPAPPVQPQPAAIRDTLHLIVRNRTKLLFNDTVKAVTSFNDTGQFDVLPMHANFISVIKQAVVVHTLDGKELAIPFDNGVFKVKNGEVKCYVDLLSGKGDETK